MLESERLSLSRRASRARVSFVSFVLFAAIFGLADPAHSIFFQGLELTDWQTVNLASGASLTISTSEDVYVFGPNGLIGDNADFRAGIGINVLAGVNFNIQNALSFCVSPVPCGAFPPYDLATDLVINILDPFIDLTISGGGSMVIGTTPVPEPSSGLLLLAGVAGIARRVRRASSVHAARAGRFEGCSLPVLGGPAQ